MCQAIQNISVLRKPSRYTCRSLFYTGKEKYSLGRTEPTKAFLNQSIKYNWTGSGTKAENQQDNEIVNWLKSNNCEFALGFMYRTKSADVKSLLSENEYDMICLFTPSGVKSLFDNIPKYKQNGTVIGAFGNNTMKAIVDAGLKLDIKAPLPEAPSMISAIELYIQSTI